MKNINSKDSTKLASWFSLAGDVFLGVWVFMIAIKSSSAVLFLSVCGFILMGVASFRYPPLYTKPLSTVLRDDNTKADSKTAIIFLSSLVLIISGFVLHWVL